MWLQKNIYTYIDRYKKITGKNINLNLFQLEQKIREREKNIKKYIKKCFKIQNEIENAWISKK